MATGGNALLDASTGKLLSTQVPTSASPIGGFVGDGSDGAAVFDGTNTYTGFTTTTGAAPNLVYTLSRDVYLTTGSVSASKTLITGDWRVFATVSFTVNGTTKNPGVAGTNGTNASGSTHGSGGVGGYDPNNGGFL